MKMSKKPNILIILSDQLRRHVLSIYGDPNISTPNIDHLAKEGVRFTSACSTFPICVPFRFTLQTGEYAHSRFVPAIEWRMSPAERTLADEFNEAGYHTIYIGKWHLYGGHALLPKHSHKKANKTPVPPEHQGRWQKWLGFELANDFFDWYYFEDDDPTPKKIDRYQTDGLFDLAIDYLGKQVNSEKPFLCILSVEPPHFPLGDKFAPADLAEKWRKKSITFPPNFFIQDKYKVPGLKITDDNPNFNKKNSIYRLKQYYAMVENLDINMGRMLDFLKETGLKEDTIVIFMADHGEMGGAHNIINILKDHPFEESIGIPLIIYDPRLSKVSGRVINDTVCTEDLYPTLLGLAGIDLKDKKPGMNLTPLIYGEISELPREGVMLEFVHDLRKGAFFPYHEVYWRGFRTQRYKYTVLGDARRGGKPWQFFNLEKDPYEMENLINNPDYKSEIIRLHKLLRDQLEKSCDHYVLARAYGMEGLNLWRH